MNTNLPMLPLDGTLDQITKALLLERLVLLDGNKGRVAQSLGVTERTVYNMMHRYQIDGIRARR